MSPTSPRCSLAAPPCTKVAGGASNLTARARLRRRLARRLVPSSLLTKSYLNRPSYQKPRPVTPLQDAPPPPSPHPHQVPQTPSPKTPDPDPSTTYTRDVVHRAATLPPHTPLVRRAALLLSLPGFRWDSHTVARVLKTHPPLQKAFLFFRLAASRLRHDRFTYTSMLHLLGEAGRVQAMLHLLQEMARGGVAPDAATWTVVMHWMARAGDVDGAMRVWAEMRARRGCAPTVVSYTACVKILFDAGREEEAAQVFEEMVAEGLRPSCTTYTVLIERLAGTGRFEAALDIMNKMQEAGVEPDKALCNIFVQKCSKAGETSALARVLQYMKEHFIVLRQPVFLEALDALRASGENDDLLREVNPHLAHEGIECDMTFTDPGYVADRSIVLHLLTTKNWPAVEQMIDEMTLKGLKMESHILSGIIEASCTNCRPSCGLAVLHYSLRVGNELERSAYCCLLGQYIRNGSFDLVLEIVDGLVNSSYKLGTYLAFVLIHRLGCAGHYAYAAQVFRLLTEDHNVVTYTVLMNAYFQAGEVDKALELFSQMRSDGISTCSATYHVLIYGLQKAGRKRDSEHYQREKMEKQWHLQYRDAPSPEEILCNYLICGFHG